MATYLSDDEQVEALKRWWKENGNALIIGVALVLAGALFYRQWQASRLNQAETASDLYQQISDMSVENFEASWSEEDFSQAQELYQQLREDHENSIYARYGALMLASVHVRRGELEEAVRELNWILENPNLGLLKSVDDELFLAARLRLARVVLAQGKPQEAMELLTAVEPGELAVAYAEARGDAHAALEQLDEARAAYQQALDETNANPYVLRLKRDDLGEGDTGEDDIAEDASGESSLGEDILAEDLSGEDGLGENDLGEADRGEGSLAEDSLEGNDLAEDDLGAGDSGEADLGEGDTGESDLGEGDGTAEDDLGAGNSGEAVLGEDSLEEGSSGENDLAEDDLGAGDSGEADLGEDSLGEDAGPAEDVSSEADLGEDDIGEADRGEDSLAEADGLAEDVSGEADLGEDSLGENDLDEQAD